VEVVDGITALLPKFRELMPPSVDLNVLYDRSVSIRDSVGDVKFTLFLALILVILVISCSCATASATLIPSLALPMFYRRHVCGDVSAELFARQPVLDGADALGFGLCGG